MYKEVCNRCGKPVYPTDKIGPLKDATFYHKGCFKCYLCGTRLALKTYCNNRNNIHDKEVYCKNHVPIAFPHHDLVAAHTNGNASPMSNIISNNNNHLDSKQSNGGGAHFFPKTDAGVQDLKIQAAMKATQIAKPYPKIKYEGAKYVVDYDAQTRLELMHRQDEDQLYKQMEERRIKELRQFEEETKEEWERALAEFTKRYEGRVKRKDEEDLIRHLTLKREKKLETINTKRLERERMMTAELVDKQAREMLDLFRQSRNQRNLEKHSECEVEETNSSCGATSSYSSYPATPPPPVPPSCSKRHIYADNEIFEQIDQVAVSVAQSDVSSTFTDLVRTLTAGARNDVEKARAIYRWITVKNLNVMVFDDNVDSDTPMGLLRGIKFGTESYHVLFKRLCSYAGLHCCVIKGYSKSAGYQPGMQFEDSKFRNTWNAVFLDGSWRFVQCNWGARHLVNNSKDGTHNHAHHHQNGYQNGENNLLRYEFDDHYFCTDPEEFIYEFFPQDQDWQLLPRPITIEQFEALPFVRSLFFKYGLNFTDPKLPAVIKTDKSGAACISISMGQEASENLIFHYSLRLYHSEENDFDGISLKRYVMQTQILSDRTTRNPLRLNNWRNISADRELLTTDDSVFFRVHCPTTKPLLLDIFANSIPSEHYLTGQPIKFKSICKFKILCDSLNMIMVPLPECAGGEWGPAKAYRLFSLVPLTHHDGIINCGQYCEIKFKMLKPLYEFVTSLHQNGMDSRQVSRCVHTRVADDTVTIFIELADEGQYGIDIYTREGIQRNANGKQLLTHCCKYLINSRVDHLNRVNGKN